MIAEVESHLESERRRRGDAEGRFWLSSDDITRPNLELRKLREERSALEVRLSRYDEGLHRDALGVRRRRGRRPREIGRRRP